MWYVDPTQVSTATLSPTHDLVQEILKWACNQTGRSSKATLVRAAMTATPKRLGTLARRTDLKSHMVEMASLPMKQRKEVLQAYLSATGLYGSTAESPMKIWQASSPRTKSVVRELFDYLYRDLLNSDNFQELYLCKQGFDKSTYRTQFSKVQRVCPYCDWAEIELECQSSIDHYLPKAYFPLLSIFWLNLIPSCTACNDRIKGDGGMDQKGVKATQFEPLLHPFFDDPCSLITITFDPITLRPSFTARTAGAKAEATQNYIRLFELVERYNSDVVLAELDNLHKRVRRGARKEFKRVRIDDDRANTILARNTLAEALDEERSEEVAPSRRKLRFSIIKDALLDHLIKEIDTDIYYLLGQEEKAILPQAVPAQVPAS